MPKLTGQWRTSISGFTLIELAIVLVIAGLLTTAAMQAYDVYQKDMIIRQTDRAMARADEAINKYYARYGRFPCPADPAKTNEWRGKEWGRDRQTEGSGLNANQSQYDSNVNGYIDSGDNWYPVVAKKIWSNGTDGPISDVYCRKDTPNDPGGTLYNACVSTGKNSQCKLAINTVTGAEVEETNSGAGVNYRWPTPQWNDMTGDQNCGMGANPNGITPSKHACTATGERPDDDALDKDGNPKLDDISEDPNFVLPEEISCLTDSGGATVACTIDEVNADDRTAGGDGTVPLGGKSAAVRGLQVLIGALPFYDLGVSETELLDGYGNPLRYAVTLGLTKKDEIDPTQGGIVLTTQEPGTSYLGVKTVDRPHGANVISQEKVQYVIISHGKNATNGDFYSAPTNNGPVGASTAILMGNPRVVAQCKNGTATGGNYTNNNANAGDRYVENENCDADANFNTSPGLSISWQGVGTPLEGYFDDRVISDIRSTSASLWIANEGNVYNTNTGNVGVGVDDPLSKLDIVSDMLARGDVTLGGGGLLCGRSTSDSDYNRSYDCGGDGILLADIADGTDCLPNMILTSIKNGGGATANYTCTSMIAPITTDGACPPDSPIPPVKQTVLAGYDPTWHAGNPYKCVDLDTPGVCKWCKRGATDYNNAAECIPCP